MMEQTPFHERRKKSREASPGTLGGTTRNQEIMKEQTPFVGQKEEKKIRETNSGTLAGTEGSRK